MRSKPTFDNKEVELLETINIRAEDGTFCIPQYYIYEPTGSAEEDPTCLWVPEYLESPEALESFGFKETKAQWLWNRWTAKMVDDEQSARECVYAHDQVRYEGFMAFIFGYIYGLGSNPNDSDDKYYQAMEMMSELHFEFVGKLGQSVGPPFRQNIFIDRIVDSYEVLEAAGLHVRSHLALRSSQEQPGSTSKDDSQDLNEPSPKENSLVPTSEIEHQSSEHESSENGQLKDDLPEATSTIQRGKFVFTDEQSQYLERSLGVKLVGGYRKVPRYYLGTVNPTRSPPDTEQRDRQLLDIPEYLESPETLQCLGFTRSKANEIWERWTLRDQHLVGTGRGWSGGRFLVFILKTADCLAAGEEEDAYYDRVGLSQGFKDATQKSELAGRDSDCFVEDVLIALQGRYDWLLSGPLYLNKHMALEQKQGPEHVASKPDMIDAPGLVVEQSEEEPKEGPKKGPEEKPKEKLEEKPDEELEEAPEDWVLVES